LPHVAAGQRQPLEEARVRVAGEDAHVDGKAEAPAGTHPGLEHADVLHHAREGARVLDIGVGRDRVHQAQVVLDRERQEVRRLRHIGDGLTQLHGIEQASLDAVQAGMTGACRLQPREHAQQSRLARLVVADDGDDLARIGV